MPTGYTAPIADGITFEQFVWTCARGMGALIMMRDEPANAPIPERFEPSDYHVLKIADATALIAKLQAMPDEVAGAEAKELFERQVADRARRSKEREALRGKYEAMLAQVRAWAAPSPEHVGFKAFMEQQITDSIPWDCGPDHDAAPTLLMPKDFRVISLQKAQWDLEYHTKENTQEIERTEQRNTWLRLLRESLKA